MKLQIFLLPKLGKVIFSFISRRQDLIDSVLEKYAEITNITADFCVVIKLHRFIAVEYTDASSINKLCNGKIRRGMGKEKRAHRVSSCSSTLSLTSALDGADGQCHFTPGKDPVSIV